MHTIAYAATHHDHFGSVQCQSEAQAMPDAGADQQLHGALWYRI